MANHHHLTRAVEEFLALDKGMTLFQMHAFLLVSTNEGQTQKWIEDKMETSNATASRTLSRWMEIDRGGKPGFGMIRSEIDPSDRRYRVVTLTPKGRQFLANVRAKLGDPHVDSARA